MREIKLSGSGPKGEVFFVSESEGSIKLIYKVDAKLTIEVNGGHFAHCAGTDAREAVEKLLLVVSEYNERSKGSK